MLFFLVATWAHKEAEEAAAASLGKGDATGYQPMPVDGLCGQVN